MLPPQDEPYNQLCFYTLSHPDPAFIHQHAVDAYIAQTAGTGTKPISIVFALAGLYLLIEKNYTGRQIQQAHQRMAAHKKHWPFISLPAKRGGITVTEVVAVPAGPQRDEMIHAWCAAVWEAYGAGREAIVAVTEALLK
ncbi:DUF5946 family protein [Compostibacter hankyongensis]